MIHLTDKGLARLMAIAGVVLGSLSQTSVSSAATLRPDYTLHELLTDSDAVVVATVVARQVVQAPTTTLTTEETLTELHVRRYLRGSGPAIRIVRQLGDTTGRSSPSIASDAKLEVGHTCVLFLRFDAARNVDHLTLLGFSAYELRGQVASPHAEIKETATQRDVRASADASPRRGRPTTFASLERFVTGASK